MNGNALIEHDVSIGDFCHISTGALVNGGVTIGAGSFIGSGAVLREGLNLLLNTVISATCESWVGLFRRSLINEQSRTCHR